MIELVIAAVIYVALNLVLLIRLVAGPTAADRMCAADSIDLVSAVALTLYSMYTGRAIYLDIALVVALLGFVGTVFVSRYLEGRL